MEELGNLGVFAFLHAVERQPGNDGSKARAVQRKVKPGLVVRGSTAGGLTLESVRVA
jgi:hypothetical protein